LFKLRSGVNNIVAQYAFFFDQSRCTGCTACAVACKNWHRLPPGPLKYLRVYQYEKGSFPKVRLHYQWIPCYHCEDPACVVNCPNDAIYKEKEYGAVIIDAEKCDGCRLCYDVCPYGAPVFESDDLSAKAQKCDMCIDRLKLGELPICVIACPSRALDFGPLSEITARYGESRDLEDMPSSQTTHPSIVFKPHAKKVQLVPYHDERALELMMKRDPLPPVFSSIADVTEITEGTVGRGKLVIKHQSVDDLMRCTRNDEG
jgi:anaerobic dimethyl sulfoxide reductase subunit B (iron-sulfur subunit)